MVSMSTVVEMVGEVTETAVMSVRPLTSAAPVTSTSVVSWTCCVGGKFATSSGQVTVQPRSLLQEKVYPSLMLPPLRRVCV